MGSGKSDRGVIDSDSGIRGVGGKRMVDRGGDEVCYEVVYIKDERIHCQMSRKRSG